MKSCTQVWKNRTLIVKKFLLAQMGFETEMRGGGGGGGTREI